MAELVKVTREESGTMHVSFKPNDELRLLAVKVEPSQGFATAHYDLLNEEGRRLAVMSRIVPEPYIEENN